MSLNYRAAVLHRSGTPLVIERVSAGPPGPADVVVKIRAAGLCHTDLEVISGSLRYPLPMILGHEAAGIVEEIGSPLVISEPAIMSFCPGIRIAGTAFTATGTCRFSATLIWAKDPKAFISTDNRRPVCRPAKTSPI